MWRLSSARRISRDRLSTAFVYVVFNIKSSYYIIFYKFCFGWKCGFPGGTINTWDAQQKQGISSGKKKLLFTILTRQITRRVCMDKLDSNSSATHRIWTWKNAQNDGASIPLHENQQQRNKNDDERTKLQKQLPIPKHFNCVITFTIFFFSPQNRRRFFR